MEELSAAAMMPSQPMTQASLATPSKVGAIVIGGDYQGLGIVRSLGRQQIPICVIDDEHSIARFSKYTTHNVSVPSLREERETIELLLEIGHRLNLNGWVVYPTRDETVAALSRCKEELSAFFRVPTATWNTVSWAWDKSRTYQRAEELGIPIPRMWKSGSLAELRGLDVEFPVAVKPTIKEHLFYATKVKAWRADNQEELERFFARAIKHVDPSEVVIQELIPGDGRQQFAYCAFFKQQQAIGSMVVRRTRQHPLEFGRSSTLVETIDLPILENLSERFLRAIDYYGLVEMEYKLDLRDGKYKLLDVNARTWGYHSLGWQAGVDFPYMLFADQLGIPLGNHRGQAGFSWIRLATDLPTGVLLMLKRDLRVREYVLSLRKATIEAVFSRDDLLPGVAELALIPYLAIKRGY